MFVLYTNIPNKKALVRTTNVIASVPYVTIEQKGGVSIRQSPCGREALKKKRKIMTPLFFSGSGGSRSLGLFNLGLVGVEQESLAAFV